MREIFDSMKYIKIAFALAALIGFFSSCTEKNFDPEYGNTPVEFDTTRLEIDFVGSNYGIPIRMTEQSPKASKAIVEIVSGTITLPDSTKKEVDFSSDVLITSLDLNIGAYDPEVDGEGLPTNNLEVVIPNYRQYQSVSLTLKLVGENVGPNSEMTWIVKRPPLVDVTGIFAFGEDGCTIIEENGEYWVAFFDGDPKQFPATRTDNTLTIDNTAVHKVNAGGPYGIVDVRCVYFSGSSLDPNKPTVWNFSRDGNTITHNGWFLGFNTAGTSWAGYAMVTSDVKGKRVQ